jgi:NAD(P)-dependent dehydrogenase (short-subunit alcohol dehydrogenase family)
MKVVAITGASSGIGQATAKHFAARGWKVYNLSRRPSGETDIIDIAADVTAEEEVKKAFAQIRSESGRLDLLVNNAGFGISGAVEFTELSEARSQFEVNFFGAFNCIKAALPMLKESQGRIICISSAAAIFAIPFQSFYSATKAAINILVCALANELKPFKVSICALQLGDVKTGFTGSRVKSYAGDDVYGGAIGRSVAVMEKDEQSGMSPEKIAAAIYKTANKRKVKPINTVGGQYKVLAFLNKILPHSLVNFVIRKLYIK